MLLLLVVVAGTACGQGTPRAPLKAAPNHPRVVAAGWYTAGCTGMYRGVQFATLAQCVDDRPPRRVWLSSFEVDSRQVPRGEFEQCVRAGACQPGVGEPPVISWGGPDIFVAEKDAVAAVVTWAQARAYCAWHGEGLPTEAQWEKAARGSADDRIYPWGNSFPTCQRGPNVSLSDFEVPAQEHVLLHCTLNPPPVGHYPDSRSPYGVDDTYGTVGEWVADPWEDGRWYVHSKEVNGHADLRDPRAEPNISIVTVDGIPTIDRRWTIVDWRATNVVDPIGKAPEDPPEAEVLHVVKGRAGATIGEAAEEVLDSGPAAFRCAHSIAGPPPPVIPPRAPYVGPAFDEHDLDAKTGSAGAPATAAASGPAQ